MTATDRLLELRNYLAQFRFRSVAQVLGVKRQQIEGIRHDSDALFEQLQNDTNRVKDLARDFLKRNRIEGEAA